MLQEEHSGADEAVRAAAAAMEAPTSSADAGEEAVDNRSQVPFQSDKRQDPPPTPELPVSGETVGSQTASTTEQDIQEPEPPAEDAS